MTVLIKRHSIIHHLDGNRLDTPLKLTITTFQVKDALLRAEGHSVIEIDDEVKKISYKFLILALFFISININIYGYKNFIYIGCT